MFINKVSVSELSDNEIDTYFYPDIDETIESTAELNESLALELGVRRQSSNEIKTIIVNPLYNIENWIYPEVNIHNFRYIDSKKGKRSTDLGCCRSTVIACRCHPSSLSS